MASRGIGRAIAEALAECGCLVVLGYSSGEAKAREAVLAIEAAGGRAEALQLDVSNGAETEQRIAELAKRLGRLDVLVANAGISIDGLLLRLRDEDFDRMLSVNLKGAVASARAAIKVMMRAKSRPRDVHLERGRREGQRRSDGLRRVQGSPAGRRQVTGPRVRLARHHRQRDHARLHRHRHDRRP